MKEITDKQKIKTLREANSNLSHEDACLLLGLNAKDSSLRSFLFRDGWLEDGFIFPFKPKKQSEEKQAPE